MQDTSRSESNYIESNPKKKHRRRKDCNLSTRCVPEIDTHTLAGGPAATSMPRITWLRDWTHFQGYVFLERL